MALKLETHRTQKGQGNLLSKSGGNAVQIIIALLKNQFGFLIRLQGTLNNPPLLLNRIFGALQFA
jgi:hypothetical protein